MTTRVIIQSGNDSNPSQELVVLANSTGNDGEHVVKPGDEVELWVSSGSSVQITEREAKKEAY